MSLPHTTASEKLFGLVLALFFGIVAANNPLRLEVPVIEGPEQVPSISLNPNQLDGFFGRWIGSGGLLSVEES